MENKMFTKMFAKKQIPLTTTEKVKAYIEAKTAKENTIIGFLAGYSITGLVWFIIAL